MTSGPTKIVLSREAARYIRAGTPREVKLQAARGDLPLDMPEWITVLFLLSQEPDDEIRSTALERLRNIPFEKAQKALEHGLAPPVLDLIARERPDDESLLLQIADRPEVTDETLAFLASLPNKALIEAVSALSTRVLRSPVILESLGTNPISSRSMVDKLLFLFGVSKEVAAEQPVPTQTDDGSTPPEDASDAARDPDAVAAIENLPSELTEDVEAAPNERRLDQVNLMSMVKSLTVFQKIKLALLGNKEARGILVRDRNKVVSIAAVQNPKLTENEVVSFTKSKDLNEDVLRFIARNREWTKVYQVQLGLASNPKTPLIFALKYIAYLKERDLRSLAKSRDVLPQISTQARRLVNQKKGVG